MYYGAEVIKLRSLGVFCDGWSAVVEQNLEQSLSLFPARSEGDIGAGVLLSSANFPSDHLSLVVDLDFV